jgi:hypothetical protein
MVGSLSSAGAAGCKAKTRVTPVGVRERVNTNLDYSAERASSTMGTPAAISREQTRHYYWNGFVVQGVHHFFTRYDPDDNFQFPDPE